MLIYLIGIGLVVWILIRLARSPRLENKPPRKVGDMVSCAVCGTFVPRNEAVQKDGEYYCSTQHRDEAQ